MNILITGVSGSGKTTIASELSSLGYHAINMDSVDGLCSWVDLSSGEFVPDGRELDSNWLETHDWWWRSEKLNELLAGTEDGYFCGSSGNEKEFFSLFGKVILLNMDADLINERILNNHRDHSYGKMPGEIEAILGYFENFQTDAIKAGAVVIDARKPLNEVVDLILAEARN